jgi:fatty acid desaturase
LADDADERILYPGVGVRRESWQARLYVAILSAVLALATARSILPLMFIGLPSLLWRRIAVVRGLQQHAGLAEDVLDHRLNTRTVYLNFINRYLYWNMGQPH